MNTGIEKINFYPGSLVLDLSELAVRRGADPDYLHQELMTHERSVNPDWEDSVTMAVNAAKPMLTKADKDSIGLLILCTETGLDGEKALSSWAHRYLELPSDCRHFEVKCACYCGTGAIRMSLSWLATDKLAQKNNRKALVITTDQSLISIGKPWEYAHGAGATAMLLSDNPRLVKIDSDHYGVHSYELSDVTRPLPWLEAINADDSLFSYMESLLGAYDNFVENSDKEHIDPDQYFDYNIYHLPFSGISFLAHKHLLRANTDLSKKAITESYNTKTKPSILYAQRIGGTYSSGVYLALLGLLSHAESIKENQKIGVYSYGSGSCAEFYLVQVGYEAKQAAKEAELDKLLGKRQKISIEAYEAFEKRRVVMAQSADFTPDKNIVPDLYESVYKDSGLLVYKGNKNYRRAYDFA